MVVNGFNILDPEMVSIGTGLYIGVSIIDHSCDPTAVAVFTGTTIHIRALQSMPQMDWSKVSKPSFAAFSVSFLLGLFPSEFDTVVNEHLHFNFTGIYYLC